MASHPDLSVAWSPSRKLHTAKSSFLDLPRELRDVIYAHALHVPGAIFLYKEEASTRSASLRATDERFQAKNVRYRNRGPAEMQPLSQTGVSIALLQTCKQVHAEACPVFYSANVFRIMPLAEGPCTLALPYRLLVRRVVHHDWAAASAAGQRVFGSRRLHAASCAWDWFWARVLICGGEMLDWFPNVESLSVPVEVAERDADWVPVYFTLGGRTAEERVQLAARWMRGRSPLRDERLRGCLHLELEAPPGRIGREEYAGSRFAPDEDEWDYREFEDAFELMKTL